MSISIITVVRNDSEGLSRTIESVKNQDYNDIEYIVIDGLSTDNTVEIIESNSTTVNKWISEKDSGIYDAMNKGIDLAEGSHLLFLNAGDVLADDTIISIIAEYKDNDIIYGNHLVEKNSKIILKKSRNFTLFNLLFYGTATVCHQAIFVSKRIMRKYSLEYRLKSEFLWYIELLKYNRDLTYKRIENPIVRYDLDGVGAKNLGLNRKEFISVVISQFGYKGLILSSVFINKMKIREYIRKHNDR